MVLGWYDFIETLIEIEGWYGFFEKMNINVC
jgi:hypothetical protein